MIRESAWWRSSTTMPTSENSSNSPTRDSTWSPPTRPTSCGSTISPDRARGQLPDSGVRYPGDSFRFPTRRESASMRALARSLVAIALLTSAAPAQTVVKQQGKTPPKADDPIYAEGYIRPPEAIARLVDAPRELNFTWG